MKHCARMCACLALLALPLFAADKVGNLAFLESPDAKGSLDRGQMSACVSQLVREMDLAGKELPTILVLHVSEKVGGVTGLQRKISVRRNSGKSGPPTYYEVWIVGEPTPADYIAAFENIFEMHFELKFSEERRGQVMVHIARYVKNTVSAYRE